MKRMNIAICDDDKYCREDITQIAEQYKLIHGDVNYHIFENAENLIESAKKIGGFDLYILDIVMPEMNGIELGSALRELGCDGKIIYLTSSEEFAIDAFRVKAFNYILKPIKKDGFFAAVDEALEAVRKKKEKNLIVKTKEKSIKLAFDRIIHAQLINRAVSYRLTKGETVESVTVRSSFSEAVQELLRDRRFMLCGTSTLLNLQHISSVENEAIVFSDGSKMFLSAKACREIRSAWCDYCFNGEE